LRFKTFVLTGLGFSFLGLGAVGLLLPIWPTTPFVLVSFACFSSSPVIRERIMRIPFFKEYIENYSKGKGLTTQTVWISLTWLWIMLIISIFVIHTFWLTLLLVFIGSLVTFHILWISKERELK